MNTNKGFVLVNEGDENVGIPEQRWIIRGEFIFGEPADFDVFWIELRAAFQILGADNLEIFRIEDLAFQEAEILENSRLAQIGPMETDLDGLKRFHEKKQGTRLDVDPEALEDYHNRNNASLTGGEDWGDDLFGDGGGYDISWAR